VKVAWALPFSAALPMLTPPSFKVTVPVGVPEMALMTVAVNVTDWPKVEGLSDEVTVVVVCAGLTV
jgi:hypothetical protein